MKYRVTNCVARSILTFFICVIIGVTLLCVVPVLSTSVFAVKNTFDDTDIMEDLAAMQIDGKPFNMSDYPFVENGRTPRILSFSEYCYSFRKSAKAHYGLYIYVYNQQNLTLEKDSVQNKIQLATKWTMKDDVVTASDYKKFDLKFCSASKDNLFLKYRIIDTPIEDGTTFFDRVSRDERRYDISGMELLTKGAKTAIEYRIGGTYKFSGYAKGCGADLEAESTLKSSVSNLETIRIDDVRNAFWRSQTSSSGLKYQDEIASVYFTVDNKVFEEYGTLQKIHASWYQYKTQPILVTSNSEIESIVKPYIGKRIDDYDSSIPFMLYSNKFFNPVDSSTVCDWSFNIAQTTKPTIQKSQVVAHQIPFVFSTNGSSIDNYNVSGDRILEYIYSYNSSYIDGTLPSKTAPVSADLFERYNGDGYREENIDAGDKFDLKTDIFMNFLKFGFFGFDRDKYPNYENIKPIEVFGNEIAFETNIGSKYYFDESCVAEFKQFCTYNTLGKKVVVFRYGVRDYYSIPKVKLWKNGHTNFGELDGAYIAQEYVDLDFDIIDLTFNKDGQITVLAAIMSPIDIANNVTAPPKSKDLLKWILMIIVLVVVLIIFAPILPYVLKFVIWVVTLPFRAIGWLIKPIKKKQ